MEREEREMTQQKKDLTISISIILFQLATAIGGVAFQINNNTVVDKELGVHGTKIERNTTDISSIDEAMHELQSTTNRIEIKLEEVYTVVKMQQP